MARMLSVCPTSFPIRFPARGSHILTTRSGEPATMIEPCMSVVKAYMEDLGPDASGGCNVIRGSGLEDEVLRSHNLMVRSNDPEATQFCSRLE